MRDTTKTLGFCMPRYILFHCILIVLAFSHFISSPQARTAMNDFVDHDFVSKIGIEINKKDEAANAASLEHMSFHTERTVAVAHNNFSCCEILYSPVAPARLKHISTVRLLL